MELELRNLDQNHWITLIYVGVFVLLAVTRSLYPRRFHEFFMLPVTDKYFALEGKNYEIGHPFNFLLFSVQTLSFSIFIYLCIQNSSSQTTVQNPWLFIQIITGFLVFVIFKFYFEKLMAHVLNFETFMTGYLYEKLSYANLIALYLIIFNLILTYSVSLNMQIIKITIYILLIFQAISIISSIKRNNTVIFKNIFYFILYLCALEIAPYIILYNVFV